MEADRLASLGALVAGVAHEVNTPLGISVTTGSYLADKLKEFRAAYDAGKLSKKAIESYFEASAEGYSILENSLTRAANLISSFKKIAVNQHVGTSGVFHFKDLLASCLLSLKHETKSGRHEFILHCPDSIWIESYPGAFSQIITNLAMNAITHGFRDRSGGTIRVEADHGNGLLHLLVADNGAGMEPEVQKHIFEPFFTTARDRGGSGLGLSIVFNIITQKLGGQISCTSIAGKGTDFDILIPVSLQDPPRVRH
jgi:signal transduction histidine kinase